MSLYRPCFGPWRNLMNLWRYVMMRMERMGTPMPVLGMDNADFNNQELKDDAQDELENVRASEFASLVYPLGPDGKSVLSWFGGEAPSSDVIDLARYFTWEVLSAGVAQYLALGTTSTSSRNVGDTIARVFWRTLHVIARELAAPINDTSDFAPAGSIRWFVDNNFGPQASYPSLYAPIPRAESFEALANGLKLMKEGTWLHPLPQDELMLRDELQMPQPTPDQVETMQEAARIAALPELRQYHLESPVLKQNEARDRLGAEPVAGGDRFVSDIKAEQEAAMDRDD